MFSLYFSSYFISTVLLLARGKCLPLKAPYKSIKVEFYDLIQSVLIPDFEANEQ